MRITILNKKKALTSDKSYPPRGAIMVASVREISEKKRAGIEEKKLESLPQYTRNMEATSTLAGGIAHQFNNALVGITGNIELLKMDLPDNENIDRYINPMKASAHRMAHLTNQLLAYAQGGKYQPRILSLSDLVEKSLPLIKEKIDPAIRVETDLSENIPKVDADLTQMQMVISTLVENATEAIEAPGCIKIMTRSEMIDEGFATHRRLRPGRYAYLRIEDDGKGMDEETQDRVFEPFFTTKFQGRGLGMAAVYGIIKNHNGWIAVDSQLGKGTAVHIYLPGVGILEKEEKKLQTDLPRGTGTILVIEDEEAVMDVTREVLERQGYSVLKAKSGMQAISIVKTFKGDIDLVILDVKLPDLRGHEVYTFIKEIRPNLKVVVCSGYGIEGPVQEILSKGALGFIQKPYGIKTLSVKVKEALESI